MTTSVEDLVAGSDQAMIVVTTASQSERAGCLVGFHAQCSIEPFRYAVWLSKANHTYRVALLASHFAVHFLDAGDIALAERFGTESGDSVDKFAGLDHRVAEGDVPVIQGCAAVVFAKQTLWDDGGDHVCVVGSPVAVCAAERGAPLRMSSVAGLEAGHASDERPAAGVGGAGPGGGPHGGSDRGAAGDGVDDRDDGQDVEDLQQIAVGFGHELTAAQVEAFEDEHEAAQDDPHHAAGA